MGGIYGASITTRLSLGGERLRRLAADDLGLPTVAFWFAGSAAELTAIAEHAGFPLAASRLPPPQVRVNRCR